MLFIPFPLLPTNQPSITNFLSRAFCHILSFILEHTIVWVARKLQHELRMSIPIVVCCAGKVAAPVAGLSDCEAALARGSMGNILRIQTYDFIDLYSVSVIALKCAISCYMGLRYNINLVISFMNVMPVLWHVPVCVWHAELVGYVVREKIDRVKTAPHSNWLNALSTTS